MTLTTRKPTGIPPWPIILLAGREKAGKSYGAALATASPLVGRSLWVGIGEDDPDEYGKVPGADFDIVVHDGTYDGILAAVKAASAEPPADDKPTLLIVDSMTKLWDLCVDNAQAIANSRASGGRNAAGEKTLTPDLWNIAKGWWDDVMDAIRSHRGPVVLTARLDEVMVMEDGRPTKAKQWKVQGHKSLPYDVGVVVEMHERGHALITGVRSVSMALERAEEVKGGIAVDDLWKRMGLTAATATTDRQHARTVVDDGTVEGITEKWRAKALAAKTEAEHVAIWKDAVARVKNNEIPAGVQDILREVASKWKRDQQPAPLPGTAASPPEQRDWVKDAEALETAAAVRELAREAEALGADGEVLVRLEAIASLKPGAEGNQAEGSWARPEGAPDEWNTPAVLGEGDQKAGAEQPGPEPVKKPTKATAAKPAPEPEPAAAESAATEGEEEQPF
jgi:hypothetical protein